MTRTTTYALGLATWLAVACSAPAPVEPVTPPAAPAEAATHTSPAPPPAPGDPTAPAPSDVAADPNAKATGGTQNAKPPKRTDFPPPPYEPLYERTAKPGDGKWTPYPEGTPAAEAVLFRSDAHPHKIKPHVFTIVIAADLTRLDVGFIAGVDEPKSAAVPKERRPGVIPKAEHDKLVAIFNGGFMERHGQHGMLLDGDQFVPPREGRCTVAFYRNGRLRIRTWETLVPELDSIRAYRQSSPCLVEQGQLHPDLPHEHLNRKWGGSQEGKRDVRRSAVCLDRSGKTLMYGFGDYILAAEFAAGLQRAGGYDCAQLDINWSYTRFFPVNHDTSPPTLGESFVEKLEYNKTSYITKPYWKDFFYLKRR